MTKMTDLFDRLAALNEEEQPKEERRRPALRVVEDPKVTDYPH